MTQVISLTDARRAHVELQALRNRDVDQTIRLLDVAARPAQLLAMEAGGPSSRMDLEAQIEGIVQLLRLRPHHEFES